MFFFMDVSKGDQVNMRHDITFHAVTSQYSKRLPCHLKAAELLMEFLRPRRETTRVLIEKREVRLVLPASASASRDLVSVALI
jgi:hypothetical protein